MLCLGRNRFMVFASIIVPPLYYQQLERMIGQIFLCEKYAKPNDNIDFYTTYFFVRNSSARVSDPDPVFLLALYPDPVSARIQIPEQKKSAEMSLKMIY